MHFADTFMASGIEVLLGIERADFSFPIRIDVFARERGEKKFCASLEYLARGSVREIATFNTMKTILLCAIALGFLTSFAPKAEAGYYERYVRYYDRCGRPVYGYIYRDDCHSHYPRPVYHCEPRHYYRDSDCDTRRSHRHWRPRFSFFFSR
jgi:hypothetical protein